MTRRVLLVLSLALMILSGCRKAILDRAFAYVDQEGFPSIYDLAHRRVAWRAARSAPTQTGPIWSPDGNWLVFACVEQADNKQYVGVLDTASLRVRYVEMESSRFRFDGQTFWSWSPSGTIVAMVRSGYPKQAVAILDIRTCTIMTSFASAGHLAWSSDGKEIAYSAFYGPPEPSLSHEELVGVDLQRNQSSVLFRGGMGYSVDPIEWSEAGAVLYRYFNAATNERYVKDTAGHVYSDVDRYYNLAPMEDKPPEELYSGLESVTGWSKNASGEWLLSGGTKNGHDVSLVSPDTKKASEIVPGTWPTWKPTVAIANRR